MRFEILIPEKVNDPEPRTLQDGVLNPAWDCRCRMQPKLVSRTLHNPFDQEFTQPRIKQKQNTRCKQFGTPGAPESVAGPNHQEVGFTTHAREKHSCRNLEGSRCLSPNDPSQTLNLESGLGPLSAIRKYLRFALSKFLPVSSNRLTWASQFVTKIYAQPYRPTRT